MQRLATNVIGFHNQITKLNLQISSRLNKSKSIKAGNHTVILKTDRNWFGRTVVVAQPEPANSSETLSWSNTLISCSCEWVFD